MMTRELAAELQEALDALAAIGERMCPTCRRPITETGLWRHPECPAELPPAAVEAIERARRLRGVS